MKRRHQSGMKFRDSLMARYLMLIGFAVFLLPIILIFVTLLYLGYTYLIWQPRAAEIDPKKNVSTWALESDWHELAAGLDGAGAAEIVEAMRKFRAANPLVSVVATDGQGRTIVTDPPQPDIPEVWTPGWTAEFMKRSTGVNAPDFTVVAFVGEQEDGLSDARQGILAARVSREWTASSVPDQNARLPQIVAISLFVLLLVLFAVLSWTFFYRIRRRLVRLQAAMTSYDGDGMPIPIGPDPQHDEIAALGGTFDKMVSKLRAGREREREEEELRKKLIANLSHDLRTPLTVIRSHAYSLEAEPLGERGRESLALMERKLDDLGGLIDNLLSYTLIAAGRYPMRMEDADVLRIVRTAAAQWYPVFEKEGMEVDADLPDEALVWRVDREWFVRILDNLFQNAVRHAKEGRYVGLALGAEGQGGRRPLLVRDKGPGLPGPAGAGSEASAEISRPLESEAPPRRNPAEGAGIGLSIVELMIREMGMDWSIESGAGGTVIAIWPPGAAGDSARSDG